MPAKGPFDFDDGFENVPVVKSTTQAVKNTGTAAAKQAAATTKAMINQLYAQSTPQADDDQQADVNPGAQAQKHTKPTNAAGKIVPPKTQAASATGKTAASTTDPADDAKLEETRRKLMQQHTSEYFNPTIGDLETQMKRHEQQKKQEEEMKAQQEEQEKKQEMEALDEKKKKEVPMAVQMGRNRAEQHRGASG